MRKVLAWVLVIVVLSGLAYIGWLYYLQQQRNQEVATVQELPPPVPAPVAPAAPTVTHPLIAEEAPAATTTTVDDSDKIFTDFITLLLKAPSLPDFVYSDRMLRRFVATVDNLPRKQVAVRMRPIKPVKGMFEVEKDGSTLTVSPANDARYEHYVAVLESIDIAAAAKFYASHYALFQRAYQDLGYPQGNFNDRLFVALDNLLTAPVVTPPVLLTQPKVLYRYADAGLEDRSAGQKIMMRMGAKNAARVKAVLGKFRAELTRYEIAQ